MTPSSAMITVTLSSLFHKFTTSLRCFYDNLLFVLICCNIDGFWGEVRRWTHIFSWPSSTSPCNDWKPCRFMLVMPGCWLCNFFLIFSSQTLRIVFMYDTFKRLVIILGGLIAINGIRLNVLLKRIVHILTVPPTSGGFEQVARHLWALFLHLLVGDNNIIISYDWVHGLKSVIKVMHILWYLFLNVLSINSTYYYYYDYNYPLFNPHNGGGY